MKAWEELHVKAHHFKRLQNPFNLLLLSNANLEKSPEVVP